MQSGSGLLGESPVNRSWEVCASIPSGALVNIHLQLSNVSEPVESEPPRSVCAVLHMRHFIHLMRKDGGLKELMARGLSGVH